MIDQSMFKWGHVYVSSLRSHPGLETIIIHHLLTIEIFQIFKGVAKDLLGTSSCGDADASVDLSRGAFPGAALIHCGAEAIFRSDTKAMELFAGMGLHWTVENVTA